MTHVSTLDPFPSNAGFQWTFRCTEVPENDHDDNENRVSVEKRREEMGNEEQCSVRGIEMEGTQEVHVMS